MVFVWTDDDADALTSGNGVGNVALRSTIQHRVPEHKLGRAFATFGGMASAADIKGIGGTATDTWAGQTVHASDALVMFTYGGDATLEAATRAVLANI